MKLNSFLLILASMLSLFLASCTTTEQIAPTKNAADTTLIKAMQSVSTHTKNDRYLEDLKKKYTENKDDLIPALRYARALRETNKQKAAKKILAPFSSQKEASPITLNEFAEILLDLHLYTEAEGIAKKSVKKDPDYAYSQHILGTALEAQEKHAEAEKAFRAALKNWYGNKVPVLNNLALSLMAQEKLDEAAEVLKEAKDLDADNRQIERNLRIISALQETEYEFHGDGQKLKEPPVPISKPEKTDKEEIEPAKTEAETTQETTES